MSQKHAVAGALVRLKLTVPLSGQMRTPDLMGTARTSCAPPDAGQVAVRPGTPLAMYTTVKLGSLAAHTPARVTTWPPNVHTGGMPHVTTGGTAHNGGGAGDRRPEGGKRDWRASREGKRLSACIARQLVCKEIDAEERKQRETHSRC